MTHLRWWLSTGISPLCAVVSGLCAGLAAGTQAWQAAVPLLFAVTIFLRSTRADYEVSRHLLERYSLQSYIDRRARRGDRDGEDQTEA